MKRDQVYRTMVLTALFVLLVNPGFSQSISGDWHSFLKIQGMNLKIDLHLKMDSGKWSGTWDSPDQGQFGIPFTTVSFTPPDLEFTFVPGGISYAGKVDVDYKKITGQFKQGNLNEPLTFSRGLEGMPENSMEGIKATYDKKEVYIPMRDGVKLFASVYSPKKTDKPAPVLLVRTPYNSEPGGEKEYNIFLMAYYRYIKEGYILVFQDVRGRYMSEGKFVNVRPFNPEKKGNDIDEASDTYDTADWLIKNVANNNGRIGVMGISYPGFYSTMAILAGHPAIKAVSPQAPVTNWFIGDDEHHNGAFFLMDNFSFYKVFGDPMTVPTRINNSKFDWNSEDNYDFFMRLGPVKNTRNYFPDSVKYWHEVLSHPNYDDWWKATDPRPYLKNVQPAVMTVGGWFDAEDLWGTLHTYAAIEKQNPAETKNILVMGPWYHSQWAMQGGESLGNIHWGSPTCNYYHELEVQFFNYHLKDAGSDNLPEATVFDTGVNSWKNFDTWPPKMVIEKNLWLQPSGKISFEQPSVSKSFDEYVSDPMKPVPYQEDVHLRRTVKYMTDDQRFAARRPDVMVYQTDVLTEDLTLTGPVVADLFVSTTGTDADFVVKLIDVFPGEMAKPAGYKGEVPLGGYQMLVRGEVMRGKYRNSFENPEPFKPGKVTQVKYELPDVAHTFKKGHRIMVQIQNSWFPLVDRNPQKFVNIYECEESDFQKATMRIYHDKKYPSNLKVLVSGK
ncbi:MAG TPA: CocE/NonD family hydrolase [Prolixibacteraceae bacterium]|nr:CocE/NonD family hydrolase [Prolixibacteraceae bacterium]